MKSVIVVASSILLCSCADMYVTRTEVATPGGRTAGAIDAKDYGSKGVHMITNCGVGASGPSAIYIRPFCIDTAVFKGDEALSDGEMPIRKANTPVEFANDLKEQLEKIAPARILKDTETPRTGWLVVGHFQLVDGGSPLGRFFFGSLGVGRSFLALHVRITDVDRATVVYEFFKRESVSLRRARQRQSPRINRGSRFRGLPTQRRRLTVAAAVSAAL